MTYKIQINTCHFGQFSETVEVVNARRLQTLQEAVRPGFGVEILEAIES